MTLKPTSTNSPLVRLAASVDDVARDVREEVKHALEYTDDVIASIEREIDERRAARDKLADHRTHLRSWLETN